MKIAKGKIVKSVMKYQGVSLRARAESPYGIRDVLTDAGFEDGELVVIITQVEYDNLSEKGGK